MVKLVREKYIEKDNFYGERSNALNKA